MADTLCSVIWVAFELPYVYRASVPDVTPVPGSQCSSERTRTASTVVERVRMKLVLFLILIASPALAQVTSQKRIPVGKEKEAPGEVATPAAPVVIHDTIVVYKTDSLGVFQSALSSTVPDKSLAEACGSRWLPVPIPIPIPLEHHDHAASAIVTPVQATPEPGTLTLFGTGLFGLTLYVKRPRK